MTLTESNWVKSNAETELRKMLRGVGLVGELDLCASSPAYALARGNVERLVRDEVSGRRAARNFPASVVVYLVSQGIYCYDHGGFWNLLDLHGLDPGEYGPGFHDALIDLGLETFSDVKPDGAYRWITPILLHGGIPRFCAKDVLRLLIDELRRGSADATEMVSRWVQSPTRMFTLDRPVQRFLTHGGAQAVDLVQRMIGMVQAASRGDDLDPDALGLPAYLVEALQSLPAPDRSVRHHGVSLPTATIRFDYSAGAGPELVLPAVPAGRGAKSWVVLGEQRHSVPTSLNAAQAVSLPLGTSWEVMLAGADGVLRSTMFRGVTNTPVLLFDPDSLELLRNQDRVTSRSVIALAPPGFAFRRDGATGDPVAELESDLPPLSGVWRWYEAKHLDLDGVHAMWVGDGGAALAVGKTASAVVRINGGETRPHLSGAPVPDVMTVSGRPVYAELPQLVVPGAPTIGWDRWRLRLNVAGAVSQWSLDQLPTDGDRVDLSAALRHVEVGAVDFDLIGPLGSDLRNVRIALVRRLDIERVDRVVLPDEQLEIKLQFLTGGSPMARVVRFDPGDASSVVELGEREAPMNLVVSVPRLQWTWRHGRNDVTPLGSSVVILGAPDIGVDDTLVLRAGRRIKTTLELVAAGNAPLQELPWVDTVGADGRWAFPVGTFRDTIKRSDRARLRVQARIDGQAVPLADVVAEYVVSGLEIVSEMVGATEADLVVRFDENRLFPDREFRLWPVDRPWADVCTAPIPDDAHANEGVSLRCHVPPGSYLAEVRISDGWATPSRPRSSQPDVCHVTIGTELDLRRYRSQRTADDPEGWFEVALAQGSLPSEVSTDQRIAMAPLAVMTLRQLIDHHGAKAHERAEYSVVLGVLSDPIALVRGVARAMEYGSLSDIELLQALVVLSPDIRGTLPDDDVVDLDRAHRLHPILGMLLDRPAEGDPASAARWMEYLGIDPSSDDEAVALPAKGTEIADFWLGLNAHRLREIELMLDLSDQQPLATGGFIKAMLHWLRREQASGSTATSHWVNEHRKLNDIRLRKLSVLHDQYLESIKPVGLGRPAIVRFPFDALAAAIHLVSISSSRRQATKALLEAATIAPLLTTRSVLVALYLDRR